MYDLDRRTRMEYQIGRVRETLNPDVATQVITGGLSGWYPFKYIMGDPIGDVQKAIGDVAESTKQFLHLLIITVQGIPVSFLELLSDIFNKIGFFGGLEVSGWYVKYWNGESIITRNVGTDRFDQIMGSEFNVVLWAIPQIDHTSPDWYKNFKSRYGSLKHILDPNNDKFFINQIESYIMGKVDSAASHIPVITPKGKVEYFDTLYDVLDYYRYYYIDNIGETIEQLPDRILDFADKIFDRMMGKLSPVTDILDTIKAKIEAIPETIKQLPTMVMEGARELSEAVAASIAVITSDIADAMSALNQLIAEMMKSIYDVAYETYGILRNLNHTLSSINQNIYNAMATVNKTLAAGLDQMGEQLYRPIAEVEQMFNQFIEGQNKMLNYLVGQQVDLNQNFALLEQLQEYLGFKGGKTPTALQDVFHLSGYSGLHGISQPYVPYGQYISWKKITEISLPDIIQAATTVPLPAKNEFDVPDITARSKTPQEAIEAVRLLYNDVTQRPDLPTGAPTQQQQIPTGQPAPVTDLVSSPTTQPGFTWGSGAPTTPTQFDQKDDKLTMPTFSILGG